MDESVRGATRGNEVGAMMLPPQPQQMYAAGLFRLAGFGGALVLLRSGVTPAGPTLDVGFLSPADYVWLLRLPMTPGLADQLSSFFFDCANELTPETSVEPVHDGSSGLDVRVLSSTDDRVELQFEVQTADPDDSEGINFETSRVAVVTAAEEVRVLEGVSITGVW